MLYVYKDWHISLYTCELADFDILILARAMLHVYKTWHNSLHMWVAKFYYIAHDNIFSNQLLDFWHVRECQPRCNTLCRRSLIPLTTHFSTNSQIFDIWGVSIKVYTLCIQVIQFQDNLKSEKGKKLGGGREVDLSSSNSSLKVFCSSPKKSSKSSFH